MRSEASLVAHGRTVSDIEADIIVRNTFPSAKKYLPKSGKRSEASFEEFRIIIRVHAGQRPGADVHNGNPHESAGHAILEFKSHYR